MKILENKLQTGHASTVDAAITQLENGIHQALSVMETDTGKLLSYRKLTRYPKFKNWSTSSTNEFRWIENGFGGCIKKTINTIAFITRNVIPHN